MSNKVYNKWITEPPKVILQDVLVTLEGSNSAKLTYVDYEIDKNGNHKMTHGYPAKKVLAYMNIPTIDINKECWHGDFTDEEEPNTDGTYLVCIEDNKYGKTRYKLGAGHWRKGKFVSNDDVVGWRKFPHYFEG